MAHGPALFSDLVDMPKIRLRRLGKAAKAGQVKGDRPGLGTVAGVYTPSILTILGVIMYLRFGWVLGNVGLINTLLIVTFSTTITFLTALSISAISTDQVVRTGGAYYMVSRSLGIETGGAVGLPLFFAQAFSVALYTLGFAESVTQAFPQLNQTVVAQGTTLCLGLLALRSVDLAMKVQYFIMAAIALSLLSLFLGQPLDNVVIDPWAEPVANAQSFWSVFAVFFPAVTGIMAGVSLSGDLKNPVKSIPRGTLAAVGTGYLIYMVLPIVLAYRADFASLVREPLIMRDISLWGQAILLGVWGATLSSAMGSILGAPRVLQALARDGILPQSLRWLGQGSGPADQPRYGTLFTLALTLAIVSLGELNLIAPILTLFFLTTYMVLNVAAAVESLVRSPSFRPTFKVHWSLSLLGALGCVAVMFVINGAATLVAALITLAIYVWLESRELESAWGDVRRGIWMTLVRLGLMQMGHVPDTKNWRPHFLVLAGVPTRRWHLIELASALTHNRGLITVSSVLPSGSLAEKRTTMEATVQDYLKRRGMKAMVRFVRGADFFEGAERLVEAYGLGPLVPNTILLGSTENQENRDRYGDMIVTFHQAQRNVIIHRQKTEDFSRFQGGRIDVWWGGLKDNGGLMLLLADLLQTSRTWRGTEVWIKLVVPNATAAASARTNVDQVLERLRMVATPQILVANERSFAEILQESSRTASLVILGMAKPTTHFGQYFRDLLSRTAGLPTTLFVLASQDLAFVEVLKKE